MLKCYNGLNISMIKMITIPLIHIRLNGDLPFTVVPRIIIMDMKMMNQNGLFRRSHF